MRKLVGLKLGIWWLRTMVALYSMRGVYREWQHRRLCRKAALYMGITEAELLERVRTRIAQREAFGIK